MTRRKREIRRANKPALNLGAWRQLDGTEGSNTLCLPANHLITHGVVVGMTMTVT
jgi:hypothetical protein